MLLRNRLTVFLAAAMMMVMSAAPAFAHHCTNVSKNSGAGSVGTFNTSTNTFTPTKDHGGFVTITDGSTFSYDVFISGTRPDGAMASGPDGANRCDGRGIDDLEVCEPGLAE
jgi:hypothetical protein